MTSDTWLNYVVSVSFFTHLVSTRTVWRSVCDILFDVKPARVPRKSAAAV